MLSFAVLPKQVLFVTTWKSGKDPASQQTPSEGIDAGKVMPIHNTVLKTSNIKLRSSANEMKPGYYIGCGSMKFTPHCVMTKVNPTGDSSIILR